MSPQFDLYKMCPLWHVRQQLYPSGTQIQQRVREHCCRWTWNEIVVLDAPKQLVRVLEAGSGREMRSFPLHQPVGGFSPMMAHCPILVNQQVVVYLADYRKGQVAFAPPKPPQSLTLSFLLC